MSKYSHVSEYWQTLYSPPAEVHCHCLARPSDALCEPSGCSARHAGQTEKPAPGSTVTMLDNITRPARTGEHRKMRGQDPEMWETSALAPPAPPAPSPPAPPLVSLHHLLPQRKDNPEAAGR